MSEPLLILRGSKGLSIVDSNSPSKPAQQLSQQNNVRSVDVSADGKHLAYVDHRCVKVVTLPDCSPVMEITDVNVTYVKLSPKATVLATWHHSTQTNPNNLNLYNVFTQTLLSST